MKSVHTYIYTLNTIYDLTNTRKCRGKKQMVYKTSQANKQDIRNKVTTKSRTVKQVLTVAKTLRQTQAPQASHGATGHTTEIQSLSGCHCVTMTPAAPPRLSASSPAAALCLPSSDLLVCPKSGYGFCKATGEICSMGIISLPFSSHC